MTIVIEVRPLVLFVVMPSDLFYSELLPIHGDDDAVDRRKLGVEQVTITTKSSKGLT